MTAIFKFIKYNIASKLKNTVQALKHPSADAVTLNVHKFDTTASNM